MLWSQTYHLFGWSYGASALVAALPIAVLFLLLGVLRRPAWQAGLFGLATAFAVALLAYRMPALPAAGAALNGVAFGLFPITWIVFWALVLFRLAVHTGQFATIRNSIQHLTLDPRLQALLVGFAFAGFLEGAAGFGAPVAVAASLLIGLGFSPFRAAAICLLANTAPVAFGTVGIPIVTLAGTTGLPLHALSAAVAALLTPLAVAVPVYLLAAAGGMRALRGALGPALLAGAVFGGVQFGVATYVGPQLTDLLAGMATMLALAIYCKTRRPLFHTATEQAFFGIDTAETAAELVPAEPAIAQIADAAATQPEAASQPAPPPDAGTEQGQPLTVRRVLLAWLPYVLLVGCELVWNVDAVQHALGRATVLLPWPLLHDRVLRMPPVVAAPAPYHAVFTLNWLAASGTACMAAVLLSAAVFRVRPRPLLGILAMVVRQLAMPTLTVASVLAIAFVMNYSGQTATLGLAMAGTGRAFPFFSVLLGWLGVFLTGSDTSANALFGNLQVVTAARLGLSPVLMASANSAGGVLGKMISLQTIAVAAAATGLLAQQQVRLFRFTLRHSLLLTSLAGLLALLFAACRWF